MTESVDFFFSPHPSAHERRFEAALQDGLAHGSRIQPLDPLPDEPVTLFFSANASMPIEQVAVYYTTDGTQPRGERGIATNGSVVFAKPAESMDNFKGLATRQWEAKLPGQPEGTLVYYRADGWSPRDHQRHWYADNADPITAPPTHGRIFAYNVDRLQVPAWFADAVIYHIFVDRFSPASHEPPLREGSKITDFFGGTLYGVLEKLDYIQALGANCIWLSPVFESPTHHGYNASDYHTVAKRYGTNETLRELISEAHRRGMRVLLDFVANHTSDEHPAFLAALADREGATAHWYAFDDGLTHGYRSYARVGTMPELVTDHPDVQSYLIDAGLYWLSYFGADGLRLDYVPGPLHAFWARFQREIKAQFPDALTLGEITSPLPELASYAGGMDSYMDFSLAGMLRRAFALRNATLSELLAFLDERLPQLPPTMGRATLLDNHDMHRFLWLAGGNTSRLKLAAACQMTLDGAPIIYYGTEVGLSQYSDAHKENAYARAPMFWDARQDHALLAYYRRLVALRHRHAVLRHGSRVNVPVEEVGVALEDRGQVGAYLRFLASSENTREEQYQHLLIVLNNGKQSARVRISLVEHFAAAGVDARTDMRLRDLLAEDGQEFALIKGVLELELPAMSALVLCPNFVSNIDLSRRSDL